MTAGVRRRLRRMHRRDVLGLVAGALVEPFAVAPSATYSFELNDLDDIVSRGPSATHSPGLAVALVRGDQILVAKGYGYADVASKRRVESDTAFYVASV